MTPFENYALDSTRKNAFNRSQPKSKPTEILVYVEGFVDVGFWYGILSPYEKQNNIKFDISPYSENDLTTGRDKLEKLFPQTAQHFIICLDSDYDYLVQSALAQAIKQNPYIFQTYAYAIDNLKCYAESLNALCVKATNNTEQFIDLSGFLTEYSKIIHPLLVWNIYFEYKNKPFDFSRKEFAQIITTGDIASNNYQKQLDIIRNLVNKKLKSFIPDREFTEFSESLNKLGLNETNAYLFMRGHDLYKFISRFLVTICEALKNEYEEHIIKLAKDDDELKTNKSGLHGSSIHVTCLLAGNDKFTDCFLFKKIEKDIENYLEFLKNTVYSK